MGCGHCCRRHARHHTHTYTPTTAATTTNQTAVDSSPRNNPTPDLNTCCWRPLQGAGPQVVQVKKRLGSAAAEAELKKRAEEDKKELRFAALFDGRCAAATAAAAAAAAAGC